MADHRPTLIKAPPLDPKKAQIENALELTDLAIIGPVRRRSPRRRPGRGGGEVKKGEKV